MKRLNLLLQVIAVIITMTGNLYSQNIQNDSMKIDYKKIYSSCLDGDVKTALTALESTDVTNLSEKDSEFKSKFERRFKNETDESDYLESRRSQISGLLEIYRDYWRTALLDNSNNYDALIFKNVSNFLSDNFLLPGELIDNEDSLDVYLKKIYRIFWTAHNGLRKDGKILRPSGMDIRKRYDLYFLSAQ